MNTLIKLEEVAKFLGAYTLALQSGFPWWSFLAWLLAPDISILAYAVNTRVGAIAYNLFHHQGLAVAMALAGLYLNDGNLQFAGLIVFGHSALDRALGYGLKYSDDFKHTHLGWIGKGKPV